MEVTEVNAQQMSSRSRCSRDKHSVRGVTHRKCPLQGLITLSRPLWQKRTISWTEEDEKLLPKLEEWIAEHEEVTCSTPNCIGTKLMLLEFEDEEEEKPCLATLPGDELLPAIKPLVGRKWRKWTASELENLERVLRGRRSIDMHNASKEAQATYLAVEDELDELFEHDAEFRERVDPVYVVVDISAGIPAELAAAVAAAPAALGALPQNGRLWFLSVAGPNAQTQKQNARHLGAFLSGRIPGLQWWIFTSNAAPIYCHSFTNATVIIVSPQTLPSCWHTDDVVVTQSKLSE